MTATVRTIEPTQITTREQVQWTKSLADYPATLWTLQYRFRGPGTGFNVAATAAGEGFAVTIPGTTTDDATAGIYKWQSWVTKIADATNKVLVNEGRTRFIAGFDSNELTTVEIRSANEIALDTVNAALLAFSTSDVLEYEVTTPTGSKRVKRSDKMQLIGLRKMYATLVAQERRREHVRNGGSWNTQVGIRFIDK